MAIIDIWIPVPSDRGRITETVRNGRVSALTLEQCKLVGGMKVQNSPVLFPEQCLARHVSGKGFYDHVAFSCNVIEEVTALPSPVTSSVLVLFKQKRVSVAMTFTNL